MKHTLLLSPRAAQHIALQLAGSISQGRTEPESMLKSLVQKLKIAGDLTAPRYRGRVKLTIETEAE